MTRHPYIKGCECKRCGAEYWRRFTQAHGERMGMRGRVYNRFLQMTVMRNREQARRELSKAVAGICFGGGY